MRRRIGKGAEVPALGCAVRGQSVHAARDAANAESYVASALTRERLGRDVLHTRQQAPPASSAWGAHPSLCKGEGNK